MSNQTMTFAALSIPGSLALLALLAGSSQSPDSAPILGEGDRHFLEGITRAVVEASRVPVDGRVGSIGPNLTGCELIRPGGRDCYPAFWIRDYAMSIEAGCFTLETQRALLLLTARHQQDEPWALPSGSLVPPGSIPDHISFGDRPIFYPGTLEDYAGQGGARWGKLPPFDDAFFFVHMAWLYARELGDTGFLAEVVNGKPLVTRLEEAFRMPPSRADSGLVFADEEARGVTFGFMDSIFHTGDLLFCSLLKLRAARELGELWGELGDAQRQQSYRAEVARLLASIEVRFALEGGLYRASTGKSAQPDVWGTAFGVSIGAFGQSAEARACAALAQAHRAGALAWRGNIRHVLTTDDASAETAWADTDYAKNRYQNGAYWGTATGWVCVAIAKLDRELARRLAGEYVAELREGDFRRGEAFGSPWECLHPSGDYRQNAVYMTSVTCPLAALRALDG